MLSFIFPGQGAQRVGMGKDIADAFTVAREAFAEADAALGWSLTKLCTFGPEQELMLTANSQPAILATSIAVLRVVQQETGLKPQVVAGHSLGEYTALVAAEALSFADAVRLVHKRGKYMQEAVPAGVGAMAAVMMLPQEKIEALCREAAQGQVLAPANFNGSPVVVAGHVEAIERGTTLFKAAGGKVLPLKVSAPFHCELMAPAAEKLAADLAAITFENAKVPVVGNVEAAACADKTQIAGLLKRQVTAPVQWQACVMRMKEMGVNRMIEIGPGQALKGLIKRIDASLAVTGCETSADLAALRA